jgi:putative tryptophan/tyrosine transport system substrate-binding protein
MTDETQSFMKRREFIAWIGGGAISPFFWPLLAHAQQSRKIPIVAFLDVGARANADFDGAIAQFVRRMTELGWVDGHTVTLEFRWAEGSLERVAEIAAEFVRLKADVIVATGNAVRIVQQATKTIPIVFPIAADPIGNGFVESLARPGGNATGNSLQVPGLAGKRLELLRQLVPQARRLAVMGNIDNRATIAEMEEVRAAAPALGFEVVPIRIRLAEEIEPAFEAIKGRADAIYLCSETLLTVHRARIAELALAAGLPAMSSLNHARVGGLVGYGTNIQAMYARTGDFVDKILRGANPAEIPVEQPTKFDLFLNLVTAKKLGITLPRGLIARADALYE